MNECTICNGEDHHENGKCEYCDGTGAVIESLLEQAGKLSEEYISGTLDDGDAYVTWLVVE